MSQILLIRHAQASANETHYDRLSTRGEEQSRLLGEWLAECGPAPDRVVTGTMQRHRRTAELCMASFDPVTTNELSALDELDHVELLARHRPDLADMQALHEEMRDHADPQAAFQLLFEAAVARWIANGEEYSENWLSFRTRVLAGFASLQAAGPQTLWVFTSGGPIAVIANALFGAPADNTFALAWPLFNASMTSVRVSPRGAAIECFNNAPHLQRQRDPRLITHR